MTSVSDGTRTWTYSYDTLGNLTTVRQPDGSLWQLGGAAALLNKFQYLLDPDCDTSGNLELLPLTGSLTHPSGAVGTFTLVPTMHGRSQVNRVCRGGPITPTYATFPKFFATHSLTSKTITGPGLPSLTWTHAYGAPNASWSPCSGCAETKTVSVTNPQGWVTRYTFGNRYLVNEGKLLIQDDGFGTSSTRSTSTSYRSFGSIGSTGQSRGDSGLNSTLMAVEQKAVTQQGVNFTWQASSFDGFARPNLVTRSSGLGYSRADTTAYFDQRTKWVLGQVASVTESSTGLTSESYAYDAATANRLASYSFGLLQESYSYNADGTLFARYDPLSRATVYTNYKRGLAQNVSYPNSTAESAVVNNLGLITAHTNPAGTTSGYGYDAMGRLASITPPGGDAVAYFPTTLLFEQVASAELGLAAGHWRQTVATGNARTMRYFDGLWRERLSYTYDLANPTATGKALETRYDADGRKLFTSYAQRNLSAIDSALNGTASAFDALGREFGRYQDSELGVLTTSTAYLSGCQESA